MPVTGRGRCAPSDGRAVADASRLRADEDRGISPTSRRAQTFEVLRKASSLGNRKLRLVAEDVVLTGAVDDLPVV